MYHPLIDHIVHGVHGREGMRCGGGGWYAWQVGACMAGGGMHGREHAWQVGHVWQGSVHGAQAHKFDNTGINVNPFEK